MKHALEALAELSTVVRHRKAVAARWAILPYETMLDYESRLSAAASTGDADAREMLGVLFASWAYKFYMSHCLKKSGTAH